MNINRQQLLVKTIEPVRQHQIFPLSQSNKPKLIKMDFKSSEIIPPVGKILRVNDSAITIGIINENILVGFDFS